MKIDRDYENELRKAREEYEDFKERGREAIGRSWEEVEKELFTEAEIIESHLKATLVGELIKARQEQGISQKKLEELSGVKQPVIARLESGNTNSQINTLLKILAPLGKKLAIVPMG